MAEHTITTDNSRVQLPQTHEEIDQYRRDMEEISGNLYTQSSIIEDYFYVLLPPHLLECVDAVRDLLGNEFARDYNWAINMVHENPQVKRQLQDIYNRVNGILRNSQCFTDTYLAEYILWPIGQLLENGNPEQLFNGNTEIV
jgi:hypothetical protein